MTIREEIDAQFPIRKTTAQKRAFEKWVMAKMREMGYRPYVDGMNRKDKLRHRNIVAGDPQNAELLISAHYDTAATIGVPDLRIPRNFPVYILSQGAVLLGMLLISLLIVLGNPIGTHILSKAAYKSGHHVWTLEEDAKEDKEDADLHH